MGDRGDPAAAAARAATPAAKGGGTPWLTEFQLKVGNYELVPPSDDINVGQTQMTHGKVISLLGGGEPSDASKLLYSGCQNPDLTQFEVDVDKVKDRQDFIVLLSTYPDISTLKKKEPRDPDPPTLEFLLGKDGAEAYKKACREENQSRAFRDAVFLSATKTYAGEKLDNRVVIWVGGPSASGKSYATDDLIEQILEEKSEKQKTERDEKIAAESGLNENHFVSVDGGVERQVSQMRQLVLQIALAKGYSGIADLTKYDESIKAKKHVKNAALKSENKLNMVIPATFTDPLAPLKKLSLTLEKTGAEQIYAQVREAPVEHGLETFKETVAVMGNQRAFGADMLKDGIKPNNLNIKVESKVYEEEHFDRGVSKSDARREFFGEKIASASYYEITFDLIFVNKGEDGRWIKVPNQLPLPKGTLKTNSRAFEAYIDHVGIIPNLEPGDFSKKVWVKKTGDWINTMQTSKPDLAVKDEYMVVSMAAFKIAKATPENHEKGFEELWKSTLEQKFNIKNFKSSIHKGGNPAREELSPPLLKQKRTPNLHSSGPGFLTRTMHALSAPVLEVAEPNLTLETIKLRAKEPTLPADDSKLNIKILSETKASTPNAPITSLKFESNNPHEASHVKYEAEVKKNTNTVVYKMEPGNAGANFSTPIMQDAYALLVKVAFEGHFGNPATKNNQFIITVLPNLGDKRKEAFIQAIKTEAILRVSKGLDPKQIKLMVPGTFGSKEMSIDFPPKNHAANRL